MWPCISSILSWGLQFVKFLTGGLHFQTNVSYTETTATIPITSHFWPAGQKKKSIRGPVFVRRRLAEYPIPKRFEDLYFDEDPSVLLDNFPYLGEELIFANYKDKFANLLYLEEMEQTEQMTQYR